MDPRQLKLMENVGKGILQVAEAEERKLDAKLKDLETLGLLKFVVVLITAQNIVVFITDEDDFEMLRQKRRLNLQKQMRLEQDWRQLGHGV